MGFAPGGPVFTTLILLFPRMERKRERKSRFGPWRSLSTSSRHLQHVAQSLLDSLKINEHFVLNSFSMEGFEKLLKLWFCYQAFTFIFLLVF